MRKILMSVLVIGLVAATAFGATRALFSDTESSNGNTFTAGTIDISVGDEPWSQGYNLLDMKPSYTDYINFTIYNDGTNPANITKIISEVVTGQGISSEPECVEEDGIWEVDSCTGGDAQSDIDTVIGYDLWVEVYNGDPESAGVLIWHQMLYNDDITIAEIDDLEMFLGMLPTGWYMKVYQSYHMREETGNWAQGDTMMFNITLNALQLTGVLAMEDKTGDPDWDIDQATPEGGTLTYQMSHPTFDFTFTGIAPLAGSDYVLISYVDPWPGALGTYELGRGTSDGSGNITIVDDVELNSNLDNVKVWLVLAAHWNGTQMVGWNQSAYLYETGLIEYRDTDL